MSADKTTRRPLRMIVAAMAPFAALAFTIPALAIAAPGEDSADAPQARITQAPRVQITQAPTLSGPDGPTVQITQAPTVR